MNFKKEYDLSERELSVVVLILKGFSNKEISLSLRICLSTVEFHKTNIFQKTGFKSSNQLIVNFIK